MSAITLELDSLTENRLQERSRLEGRGMEELAANLLVVSLAEPVASEIAEALLLEKIKRGWNEQDWQRYHALVTLRKAETLTEAEYLELCDLSNQREIAYSNYLLIVFELSRLRNSTLLETMKQLGIGPRHVE